jgi:protein-disulfide isomerase
MVAYGMASGPLSDILTPSTPTLGDPKAPILIVEFSDFTCGYCGKFYRETLPQLKTEYLKPGKLRFAYRDYPRDEEGWGLVAAHAARCAGEQGRFWEMHDRLFEQHARLGTGVIIQLAKGLRLDTKAFGACMDSQKHITAILADRETAVRLRFRGTPGFLIVRTDGRRFSDAFTIPGAVRYETFRAEIERLLKKR